MESVGGGVRSGKGGRGGGPGSGSGGGGGSSWRKDKRRKERGERGEGIKVSLFYLIEGGMTFEIYFSFLTFSNFIIIILVDIHVRCHHSQLSLPTLTQLTVDTLIWKTFILDDDETSHPIHPRSAALGPAPFSRYSQLDRRADSLHCKFAELGL